MHNAPIGGCRSNPPWRFTFFLLFSYPLPYPQTSFDTLLYFINNNAFPFFISWVIPNALTLVLRYFFHSPNEVNHKIEVLSMGLIKKYRSFSLATTSYS